MDIKKKEIQKQNKSLKRLLIALVGMQVAIILITILKTQTNSVGRVIEDSGSAFPFWIIWIAVFVPLFVAKKKNKPTPEGMRLKYIVMVALGLLVLLGMLSFFLFI